MKINRLILLLFTVLPAFSYAQDDHLVPVRGIFSYASAAPLLDGYYYAVVRSLTSGVERSKGKNNLRIMATPASGKEWLLQINFYENDDTDTCTLVILSMPNEKISSTDFSGTVQNNVIKKCIDNKTAYRISGLLKSLLKETRYSQTAPGLDGISYYFSSFVDGLGLVDGTTWSPPAHSKMRYLTKLADSLKNYASSENNGIRDVQISLEALERYCNKTKENNE